MKTELARPEAPADLNESYERLPIGQIVPSTTNPRTHVNPEYLKTLADSITEKGVLEPILVRPLDVLKAVHRHPEAAAQNGAKFEIVAGECRYRASQLAGVATIPSIIRAYTDEQVLEIQLIENIHRKDLRPLERARGFRRLIDTNPTKHSAESIATRIGLSASWVWDLMKLLDLIPEAQQLLDEERIALGHAIPLARLKPKDQKRAIHPKDGGLFEPEDAFLPELAGGKKPANRYAGVKVRSIREFTGWIADHIRFDVAHAAKAAPLEFEAAAAQVEAAQARPGRGKKLVAITHGWHCPDGAKDESERTFGSQAWKRADGLEKSKACDHAVLGVVVAGEEGYGQQFDVCIARDKCTVHWGQEIAAREKTQKLRDSGKPGQAQKREAADQARARREDEERKRKQVRWQHVKQALTKATLAAIDGLRGSKLPAKVFKAILDELGLPATTTVVKLPYALLESLVERDFDHSYGYYDEPKLVAWAKLLGVNIKACEPPVQTSGAKAKKNAKGKAA